MKMNISIKYNDKNEFIITNANGLDYDYFPLTNGYTLKSSINHNFNGDMKLDQNHFILSPVSELDLKNSLLGRNVYLNVNDEVYNLNGSSPLDKLNDDEVTVKGGFLYYEIERKHRLFKTNTLTYSPFNNDNVEVSRLTITNTSNETIKIKSILSIPLYSRSADSIRDHRHVTSLLNKIEVLKDGIINTPTMLFDEKSHLKGDSIYGVFTKSKVDIKQYFPTIDSLTLEGSELSYPSAIVNNVKSNINVGDVVTGLEALGGFEFKTFYLVPNNSIDIYFVILHSENNEDVLSLKDKYLNNFDFYLNENKENWKTKLSVLEFKYKDNNLNNWLKWVSLQPILRRIFGCSFLPHHDYGKGGRGWRDLWQDLLSLLYMEPKEVEDLLFNNFIGVRLDGSNATIIGDKKGEFKADRNAITRVWSDHGAWPYLTLERYINISGNKDFLLKEQVYFKDKFTHYTKKVDEEIIGSSFALDEENKVYYGTILEHLIIQNLVAFYNVGNHGFLKLENADWNDGLDMASDKGESIAFTSLYGSNLVSLGNMIKSLDVKYLYILKELNVLLKNDDLSIENKKKILRKYFNSVAKNVSTKKAKYNKDELGDLLINFGKNYLMHVRKNAWVKNNDLGYFIGYYDNDGNVLEDIKKEQITLTGQVFALMGEVATNPQIDKIINSVDKLLYEEKVGGYRLNTNFNEVKFNMGRLFGFGYGQKENGAMFSHMAIMYANSLYKNNRVKEGYKVINSIYNSASNINTSMIYPGIPEYFNNEGRGMYHYLTGSASWLLLTLIEEVFGIKRVYGNLLLSPKLLLNEFNNKKEASIKTLINNKVVEITYVNMDKVEYGDYVIKAVYINDKSVNVSITSKGAFIDLDKFDDINFVKVILKKK